MKHKGYTIFSVDIEKAFDRIKHLIMIKTLKKIGVDGTDLKDFIIKSL